MRKFISLLGFVLFLQFIPAPTEAKEFVPGVTMMKQMKSPYPVHLIAKRETAVMDQHGTKLEVIEKGQKIILRALSENKGVIDFLTGSAFIMLTDFHYTNLVDGAKKMTYPEVEYKLNVLAKMYPSLTKLEVIGQSVEGRNLSALTLGTGEKQILMDAAFHGREHMTTNVLMKMLDTYAKAYVNDQKIGNYQAKAILDKVSIVFVPMVNPDGVTLAQGGNVTTSVATLKAINGGSVNFDRWKANIRGVDLNRQFDVNWDLIKTDRKPAFKGYKGKAPFTEPEAIAMKRLIDAIAFKSYVSYHSAGQIIYWSKGKTSYKRAEQLVQSISKLTGYKKMPITKDNEPIAASEDYFSKVKDMPAMTIEIAPFGGDASVAPKHWADVWKRNQFVGLHAASEAAGEI